MDGGDSMTAHRPLAASPKVIGSGGVESELKEAE